MQELIQSKIDAAKASSHRVFKVKVAGVETVYRSLSRKEFRDVQKKVADKTESLKKGTEQLTDVQMGQMKDDGEEMIAMRGVISPVLATELDLIGFPAGFVPSIAELILSASGFGEDLAPTEL